MLQTEARRLFDLRCCSYAASEFAAEAAQDFPLLRTIPNKLSRKLIMAAETMVVEDRVKMAVALTKRFHINTIGESLSEEESKLISRYLDRSLLNSGPSSTDRMVQSTYAKTGRKELAALVHEVAGHILGEPKVKWSSDVLRYTRRINGWQVDTSVDLGSSLYDLAYYHFVHTDETRLVESISLFNWWGLGGQTYWQAVNQANAQRTVESLAEACTRFLRAAPTILAELSCEA